DCLSLGGRPRRYPYRARRAYRPRWKSSGSAAAAFSSRTAPTPMWWSPPSWTRWTSQSVQAPAPARCGAPAGAGLRHTLLNLSVPERENLPDSAAWSAARTLTQKRPELSISGQLVESRPGRMTTRGGSRDNAENDWRLKPAGASGGPPVTTVTPLAKWP